MNIDSASDSRNCQSSDANASNDNLLPLGTEKENKENNSLAPSSALLVYADSFDKKKSKQCFSNCNELDVLSYSSEYAVDTIRPDISSMGMMMKNSRRLSARVIKGILSPSVTRNNLRFLGGAKDLDIEIQKSNQSFFIIHPLSTVRKYWDLVMVVVMVPNIIILPLDIAFFKDTWFMFHFASDVICMIDVIMNFRTGYWVYPEMRKVVTNGRLIAKRYLKTWFAVDFISSLPLHYVSLVIYDQNEGVSLQLKNATNVFKFMKILKLLNLVKLFRLSRVIRTALQYQRIYGVTEKLMRYVKVVFMMIVVAHWNGCLHFLLPMLQGFPKDCWVVLCDLEDEPWHMQYGWAIFKTFSHMLCIGYGRFIPTLMSEAFLTIFTMITGATFYALFIANAMASMIHSDSPTITLAEKKRQTEEYLRYKEVPVAIRDRVDAYFYQKYSVGKYFINERTVLSEISKPLKDDIILYTCRDMVDKVSFLKNAPKEFVSAITAMFSADIYLPEDLVVKEGRMTPAVYFVQSGELVITIKDKVIEYISAGSYFGEIGVLTNEKSLYSVKALRSCDIFVLSESNFNTILKEYESTRPLVEHDAIERLLQIYLKCKFSPHMREDQMQSPTENVDSSITRSFKTSLERLIEMKIKILKEKKEIKQRIEKPMEVKRLITLLLEWHQESHRPCNICMCLLFNYTECQQHFNENNEFIRDTS